jgi:hypothetical protein
MPAYFGYQVAILASLAFGPAPVPEPAEVSAQLDKLIEAKWTDRGVTAEGTADDATFLRRVWLDLAGRVPSALVAREFLDDPRKDKRVRLVDALLASEDFADHWARAWTIRLTEKRPIRHEVHDGGVLQRYLRDSLLGGKSYQHIARELITGDGAGDSSGPANFLLRYGAKPEALAGAVGKTFMGATLQCAQCHDHVFAHWKQEDFRGLAAFFGRLKLLTSEDGSLHAVVESRRGEFQFMEPGAKPGEDGNIPLQTAAPRLPIVGASPLSPQTPRRQALAAWLTAPDNPWFTRHAVNSTWQELFARPLVPSLDDPAVAVSTLHGDVLELLSDDFLAGGYDLKRLIRIIVLSGAYQRAPAGDPAAPAAAAPNGDQAHFEKLLTFAAFPIRPLTVDQLYGSINQATGNRSNEEAVVDDPGPAAESPDAEAQEYSDHPVEALGEQGASMQRALVLLNSPFVHEAVESGTRIAATLHGRRIGRAHVEWLFLATLSRPPASEELSRMLELIREDQGARGLEDVLWVLLNSAEFNSNH